MRRLIENGFRSMKLLAIDTSTEVCSVCLAEDGACVAEYATKSRRTHTERLMPAVDLLLAHLEWKVQELEGLAVIHGPGSFTGLRIGLSVAKGLAFALNCPVVPAGALEIAALQSRASGLISPAMDARRGEIFAALYRKTETGVEELLPPRSVTPDQWRAQLPDEPVHFCGPGARLYFPQLKNHEDASLGATEFYLARTLAAYAADRFREGRAIPGDQLRAAYLRPSDAETKGPRPARKPDRIPR